MVNHLETFRFTSSDAILKVKIMFISLPFEFSMDILNHIYVCKLYIKTLRFYSFHYFNIA